jgi:uncharacterized membrane protein
MTTWLDVLRFLNVLGAAIMAGGQLFVFMVIIPVKRRWPVNLSVQCHQAMLHTLPDRYLLPAGQASGLCAIALLFLQHDLSKLPVLLRILGIMGLVGVAITSEAFNKPTNRVILTWSSDQVPADYPRMRDRWDRVHMIRTAFGMLALVSFLAASVLS